MANDSMRVAVCDDCGKPYVPTHWPLCAQERPVCADCIEMWVERIDIVRRTFDDKKLFWMFFGLGDCKTDA